MLRPRYMYARLVLLRCCRRALSARADSVTPPPPRPAAAARTQILCRIGSHPNVISLYEAYQTVDNIFLVLELCAAWCCVREGRAPDTALARATE